MINLLQTFGWTFCFKNLSSRVLLVCLNNFDSFSISWHTLQEWVAIAVGICICNMVFYFDINVFYLFSIRDVWKRLIWLFVCPLGVLSFWHLCLKSPLLVYVATVDLIKKCVSVLLFDSDIYIRMNYNTKTDTVIILSCSVTDICLSWSSLQTCMGIADLLVVWFLGGLLFRYLSYVDSIQQMWGHSWFGKMLCFWWSLSFWHLYHMVLTPRICSQSLLYTHDFMSWFLILISMFIDPSFGIVL